MDQKSEPHYSIKPSNCSEGSQKKAVAEVTEQKTKTDYSESFNIYIDSIWQYFMYIYFYS